MQRIYTIFLFQLQNALLPTGEPTHLHIKGGKFQFFHRLILSQ